MNYHTVLHNGWQQLHSSQHCLWSFFCLHSDQCMFFFKKIMAVLNGVWSNVITILICIYLIMWDIEDVLNNLLVIFFKNYPLFSDYSNIHRIISFLRLNFWSSLYISDIFYSSTFQFLCSWLFVFWNSLSFVRSSTLCVQKWSITNGVESCPNSSLHF